MGEGEEGCVSCVSVLSDACNLCVDLPVCMMGWRLWKSSSVGKFLALHGISCNDPVVHRHRLAVISTKKERKKKKV